MPSLVEWVYPIKRCQGILSLYGISLFSFIVSSLIAPYVFMFNVRHKLHKSASPFAKTKAITLFEGHGFSKESLVLNQTAPPVRQTALLGSS